MTIIRLDDVDGFKFDNEICCYDCATDDECLEVKRDEVIISDDIEKSDDFFFCDRCKKRL